MCIMAGFSYCQLGEGMFKMEHLHKSITKCVLSPAQLKCPLCLELHGQAHPRATFLLCSGSYPLYGTNLFSPSVSLFTHSAAYRESIINDFTQKSFCGFLMLLRLHTPTLCHSFSFNLGLLVFQLWHVFFLFYRFFFLSFFIYRKSNS